MTTQIILDGLRGIDKTPETYWLFACWLALDYAILPAIICATVAGCIKLIVDACRSCQAKPEASYQAIANDAFTRLDLAEQELKTVKEALGKAEKENNHLKGTKENMEEFGSQIVSKKLDPSVGVPWMRCSPDLPQYVARIEKELEELEASADAVKAAMGLHAGHDLYACVGLFNAMKDRAERKAKT